MNFKRFLNVAVIAGIVLIAGCGKDNGETASAFDTTRTKVLKNYADLVLANYTDAHSDASDLKEAINTFVEEPTSTTHKTAKDAWLAARETYGQTEAFRFYGGPIDDEDGPEGQLNAWPLDESYIDYVDGKVNGDVDNVGTNIINSTDEKYKTITKELIASLNEQGGETNVASGYHAIEFLLWGQDKSDGAGGGERSHTDYLKEGGTNDNQDRRGTYLKEAAQLIVDDLSALIEEWKEGGAYRTAFLKDEKKSLENIISALGKLSKGELSGERMFVALDAKSKEDEHSCFSDNTHRDIVTNALGIQNVYLGRYVGLNGKNVSGDGIYNLLLLNNKEIAEKLKTEIAASVDLAKKIQAPFDQEFLNSAGQARIQATITSLRSQGDNLAAAAKALGFTFDPDDI